MSHLRCYLLVCFLQGLYWDFFRRTAAMFWFSLLAISVQPEEEEKTKEKKKDFSKDFSTFRNGGSKISQIYSSCALGGVSLHRFEAVPRFPHCGKHGELDTTQVFSLGFYSKAHSPHRIFFFFFLVWCVINHVLFFQSTRIPRYQLWIYCWRILNRFCARVRARVCQSKYWHSLHHWVLLMPQVSRLSSFMLPKGWHWHHCSYVDDLENGVCHCSPHCNRELEQL